MNQIDILIVGAGPSGLMMAAMLAQYNLNFRIIDKASASSDKSKAIAIQARTLETLDYLGIAEHFISEGIQLKAANPISQKKLIAHISLENLDSPYPFVLSLEQSKTEKIFEKHLFLNKVTIEREVELIHFEQNKEKIDVTLRNNQTKKEEHLTASWIIGCDGAHSLIRKKLGLSFQGKVFSDIFSLADIHLDWKYPHDELFVFLEPEGVMAALPIAGKNRYRLIFQLERCRNLFKKAYLTEQGLIFPEKIPDPTLEETQQMLTKYIGENAILTDPVWMANFHINSRLTNHYRKNRVFLVGDAAHIHSPVGGQGMNTGLQDAFNLAWKLAYVLQKKADESLLDSYQKERYAVGKTLLKATERASFIATLHNPLAIFLRNRILSWLTKKIKVQKFFIRAISELGIHYPKSSIIYESNHFQNGPSAGQRAPNAIVNHNGKTTDLFSLWRKKITHTLLVFVNPEQNNQIIHDLQDSAKKHSVQMILVVRYSHNLEEIPGFIVVKDISDKARQIYKAGETTAYMIRPDGYIAFRQKATKKSIITTYFKKFFKT